MAANSWYTLACPWQVSLVGRIGCSSIVQGCNDLPVALIDLESCSLDVGGRRSLDVGYLQARYDMSLNHVFSGEPRR